MFMRSAICDISWCRRAWNAAKYITQSEPKSMLPNPYLILSQKQDIVLSLTILDNSLHSLHLYCITNWLGIQINVTQSFLPYARSCGLSSNPGHPNLYTFIPFIITHSLNIFTPSPIDPESKSMQPDLFMFSICRKLLSLLDNLNFISSSHYSLHIPSRTYLQTIIHLFSS